MIDARVQPLPIDPAPLRGLSEKLVRSHYDNNYGGAVKRLNAIRMQLATLDYAAATGFVLNGLKREELVAANSMILHELYFDGLGGDGRSMTPAMELALAANFGSVQEWREQFVAMGKALAGGIPLLALDMYEHAYHMDFGAAAGAYVDAFMDNVDFGKIYERYQQAVHAASDAFGATQSDLASADVIDVRRAAVFEKSPATIPGAKWRDPAQVAQWSRELALGAKVIVYCVYGHEVGRATALRLRAAGIDARFLRGGIDGVG